MNESQNRRDFELNPLTGDLQLVNDLEMGFSVKNVTKAPFTVLSGYTRVYPNLSIPVGTTVNVDVDGELIIL